MASRIGLALRTEAAQQRIDAALLALSDRHTFDPLPTGRYDAAERETVWREWLAGTLEQLATDEPTAPELAPEPTRAAKKGKA